MSAQTLSFGGVGGTAFSGYSPLTCSSGQALPNNSTTPANASGQKYVRITSVSLGLRSGSYPAGFKAFVGSTTNTASNGATLPDVSSSYYTAGSTIVYGATGFSAIYNFNRTGSGTITDSNPGGATSWTGDLQASISIITYPTAPGTPSVSNVTYMSADLNWSAPSDNGGSSVTNYVIQANKNGGGWFDLTETGSTATAATVTVDASASYQFRVGAITGFSTNAYYNVGPISTRFGPMSSASTSVTTPASTTTVSNIVGFDAAGANQTIGMNQLTVGTVTYTTSGATSANNNKVASQNPVAGTVVALGTSVDYALYNYIAPTYPPVWSDSVLGGFTQLSYYSDSVTATNMNYSGVYSVSAGSLPTGVSLNTSTGAVTGTPTVNGQAISFTITATNSYGSVSQAYSGTVSAPVPGKVWVNNSGTWQRCNVYVFDASNTPVLATVKTTTNGTTWTSSL